MAIAASIADYRALARRRLPRMLFDYIDGGAYSETTLARNQADFATLRLRQRVLKDVSRLNLETALFGQKLAMPVVLAPVGMAGMYARRGEAAAARAAQAAGVNLCLSTLSICAVEEVSAAVSQPIWFQLYVAKDRGIARDMLARARTAGCPVLVVTVDLATPGTRYRDARSGLTGRLSPLARLRKAWQGLSHPRWLMDVYLAGRPHDFGNVVPYIPQATVESDYWAWITKMIDPSLDWKDIAWLRREWPGPLVVKGILDPDDAREAVRAGVDGIVVSNHGGRQLDATSSSIAALPRIADAIGTSLTVLMDGGVRSGLDVLAALASGAQGILLGRAWAYALAARGQAGVAHMLDLLRKELVTAMMLTGCTDIGAAGAHLLIAPD
ncbi:MAG: L-lactate dehydrogenase [Alphaproteobacteria bacterium]|nr:MAG: L-lactate dehydrogenase [Alphaproteobacteria bacterium]